MAEVRVKLSNGKDITELLQFLLEENKKMEEEFGEPLDILEEDFEKNIQYLPDRFKELCREIFTALPQSTEYKFDEPDSVKNLEYSPEGAIIGASFLKLIEKMTDDASNELIDTVFYTFPLYASPKEMLEALIWRHNVVHPPLMSRSEQQVFQNIKVRTIQSKVASLLKKWIKLWPSHFKENKNLKTMLLRFLDNLKENSNENFIRLNCNAISGLLNGIDEEERKIKCSFGDLRIPEDPILPKEIDFKMEPLLLWSPIEIARQLSLIESDYLKRVGLGELLGRCWDKEGKDKLAPNLLMIKKRFIIVRELYITAIVKQDDINNRIKIIKTLLEVANECLYTIKNYESPFVINNALKSDYIRALEISTREVKKSAHHRAIWTKIDELYDTEFANCRAEMEANSATIPCFLAFRQALSRIDTHKPDYLESKLINIAKHKQTADIVHKIKTYKENSLIFHPIKILYQHLLAEDASLNHEEMLKRAISLEKKPLDKD
jgi:son of sevenless-like protein